MRVFDRLSVRRRLVHLGPLAMLLVGGVVFAGANVMVTSLRTCIPYLLDSEVMDKSTLAEKQAGVDDVHVVQVSRSLYLQVDRSVYEAVEVGDRIQKDGWSRTMQVNGQPVMLEWSPDVRGMLVLMPSVLLGLVVMVGVAARR